MNRRWANPRFIHRRIVAVNDRVFVTLGYSAPVSALDAATGETIQVYKGTENTAEILCDDSVLYLTVTTGPKESDDKSPPHKIIAVNVNSGEIFWSAGTFRSIKDLAERSKENVLKQGRLMTAVSDEYVIGLADGTVQCLGQ